MKPLSMVSFVCFEIYEYSTNYYTYLAILSPPYNSPSNFIDKSMIYKLTYAPDLFPRDPITRKDVESLALIPIDPQATCPPLYIPTGYNTLPDAHLAENRTLHVRILDEVFRYTQPFRQSETGEVTRVVLNGEWWIDGEEPDPVQYRELRNRFILEAVAAPITTRQEASISVYGSAICRRFTGIRAPAIPAAEAAKQAWIEYDAHEHPDDRILHKHPLIIRRRDGSLKDSPYWDV